MPADFAGTGPSESGSGSNSSFKGSNAERDAASINSAQSIKKIGSMPQVSRTAQPALAESVLAARTRSAIQGKRWSQTSALDLPIQSWLMRGTYPATPVVHSQRDGSQNLDCDGFCELVLTKIHTVLPFTRP